MPDAARVVLVTGAGRGIGRATARRLARGGALVVLADRDREGIDNVGREIAADGGRSQVEPLDVTDEPAIDAVFSRVIGRLGRLDGLVNNAALTGSGGLEFKPVWDLDFLEWRRALAVNLDGVFLCARAAARVMREARRGSIVNLSSVHAQSPNSLTPQYDASKAGVEGFTRNSRDRACSIRRPRQRGCARPDRRGQSGRCAAEAQRRSRAGPGRPPRRGCRRRRIPPVGRRQLRHGADTARGRRNAPRPRPHRARPGLTFPADGNDN